MAALSFTKKRRLPLGDKFLVIGRSGTTGAGAADEWIPAAALGLNQIEEAWVQTIGATATLTAVVPNAQGTGVAEGTNPGDVGVESSAGAALAVFAIGK